MTRPPREHDEIFDGVISAVSQHAHCVVIFDRDAEDNYVVRIEGTTRTKQDLPTTHDVMPLLPKGSQWSPVKGWRSFFGRVLDVGEEPWLALGGQRIIAHPSRGAYPILRAYLYPFFRPASHPTFGGDYAYNLALTSASQFLSDHPASQIDTKESRVIRTLDKNPQEHRPWEASIMRAANAAYALGRYLHFRTLILCDAEIAELHDSALYVVATVQTLEERVLSKESRAWLRRFGDIHSGAR